MFSCLTEIKVLLDKFPESHKNSLFYINIYEQSELIKHWFKNNNEEAYFLLIKDEEEDNDSNETD